jgi:hypothetical protein
MGALRVQGKRAMDVPLAISAAAGAVGLTPYFGHFTKDKQGRWGT